MKMFILGAVLVICGMAAAGNLHHQGGHATSYAVVTKHVPSTYGWAQKDWAHHRNVWTAVGANRFDDGWQNYGYDNKHAKYEFDYGVKDLKTGDIKNQWEHGDGDHVKGSYSLKEADGTSRIVEYTADNHNGFDAVVKHIGHAHHPEVSAKPTYHAGWNGYNAYHNNQNHGHGQAKSYIYVKHY